MVKELDKEAIEELLRKSRKDLAINESVFLLWKRMDELEKIVSILLIHCKRR